MKFVFAFLFMWGSVLGGYALAEGHLAQLWQPYEVIIILGGAFGGFLLGTSGDVMKAVGQDFPDYIKGGRYKSADYLELFSFLFLLFDKGRRSGMIALEDDIERPEESEIWQQFPKILKNHHLRDFVCDILRIKISGNMSAHEFEALMDIELETHHHEAMAPSTSVQLMADALPAFGIVAAVMGVVHTMGIISEPPDVLGQAVGAALVGTFLGVLLAYGMVGPFAQGLKSIAEEDCAYYLCAKTCFLADIQGYSPNNSLEFGRKTLPSKMRPDAIGLEERLRELKSSLKKSS